MLTFLIAAIMFLQTDSVNQLIADMASSGYVSAYQNVVVGVASCETPDSQTVLSVKAQTDQFAERATDLADATDGEEHARASAVKEALDRVRFQLTNPAVPASCQSP
jgi:hypothetical protein